MIGYYVLAFDGQLFETTLYPAVRRAYYLNDFSDLERLVGDFPLLQHYYQYAQTWTRRGCRRPLKHWTNGICEYNSKCPGHRPPEPARPGRRGRPRRDSGDSTCWRSGPLHADQCALRREPLDPS